MVKEHKVEFPVVYGLDLRKEADKLGAYFESDHGYFQPANFVLRNKKVVQASYSSGPIGRFQAEHVLILVDHYRKQEER